MFPVLIAIIPTQTNPQDRKWRAKRPIDTRRRKERASSMIEMLSSAQKNGQSLSFFEKTDE
jgi:hypothetical protein